MAAPLSRDARGLESQLAVNHVGHFRLFARMLPALVHVPRNLAAKGSYDWIGDLRGRPENGPVTFLNFGVGCDLSSR
jgi:hypothetical protein